MDLSRLLRSGALIVFILSIHVPSSYSRYHGKRLKRQNGAHMYLPESYIVPDGEGDPQEWSEWSSPSECSRSCGGGVSFQTRECLRHSPNGARQCSGGSRKYFSCNTQDCPDEEPDFRGQQCSRFDNVPFDGVRYEWIPYTNAPNPCELNCMPRGERFYYRHKAKVIDGTRCNDKTLDVCVDGECQPVGCDMMLGSSAREDKCRKCAGDGSSCKTISGIFDTNNLSAGYNDILLIPIGATNIVLKEIAPSNNYLACRNLTGHYYLNGNWRIDFPRPMHFAGSWWHYQRKPTGFAAPDQLTCSGPTTESIYIVMLIQDRNVGVQYEYSIPETVSMSLPVTYSWTHMEYGPCSRTCGGGTQSRNVTCNNRLTLEQVDESLCDANNKPSEIQVCGTEDCAPNWVEGIWSKCSKGCGKDGFQNRTVTCERIPQNGPAVIIDDSICLKTVGSKPVETQECNRDITNCPKFHIGPWTPCNKLCGEGSRTRKVTCFIEENGKKKVLPDNVCSEEKPTTEETCIIAPCEGVDWIVSQWSGCDNCGQNKETRTAICGSKSGKTYDEQFCSQAKPELVRTCNSTKCVAQWFTSEWSKCSAKCGKGIQSRIVICGEFDGTTVKPASDDSKCKASEKPESEQECESEAGECPGEWFTGPWGQCSKPCGGGQRTREVLCLANGTRVSSCEESKIEFGSESCNNQACTDDETIPIDSTSKSIDTDDTDSGEECDEDYDDEDFGVEFITEKRKEDLKLGEGVDLDEATTTLSSLVVDELMLSDSPSPSDDYRTTDVSTDFPQTTVEGSGEETDGLTGSTFDSTEGSGSSDGSTTDKIITQSTDSLSTQDTTDISKFTDDSTESSSSYADESSESSDSSTLSSPVTEQLESSSLSTDATDTTVSEDISSTDTTKTSDGTESQTTDIFSSTDTSLSTTEQNASDETSESISSDSSTVVLGTSSSSNTETTLLSSVADDSSSISTSDDSKDTTTELSAATELSSESSSRISTETVSESSTDLTSEVSTESTLQSSTETTSESSTDLTSEVSTESTSESSTETTSESSTETTSESSTETTSDSSTETTSESTTDTTDISATASSDATSFFTTESSTDSTSESSTDSTSEISTDSTSESSTDNTSESSTGGTSEDITDSTLSGSTESNGNEISDSDTTITPDSSTQSTSDSSTETSTNLSGSTDSTQEDISSSVSSTDESSTDGSTTELSSDLTTDNTSVSSEETTTELLSTQEFETSTDTSTDLSSDALSTESTENSSAYTEESTSTDATEKSSSLETSTQNTVDFSSEMTTSTDSSTITSDVSTSSEQNIELDTSSTAVTDESQTLLTSDGTTMDIWTSEDIDDDMRKTTPYSLEAALNRESKPRKCKPKKSKKEKCISSEFGCCLDKRTAAKGPFGLGCPVVKTCAESEFGCCPDGLSPAEGKKNKGCPKSLCAESLFGCCSDNFTPAEGEDNEGCPEPTTEPPTTITTEMPDETTLVDIDTTSTESSTEITESSTDINVTEITDADTPQVQTLKSCSFYEFGCCPDGKTSAKGPNFAGCDIIDEKDCSKSLYGCCRDGKTSAYGPNGDGCASCTQEPFGCCPDGSTPAHGRLGEGCCINTQFGCCPDNINAARGPNFQDCDCKYAPYGCCPDNSTAARGYDNEGCGCEASLYGCCPDKLTPAQGEKFSGCPCHTMQFGCCPDGVTIPQGPHHYGCHCSQTKYKCCSDEKTPANGPNFEGCTCAESKFGCCPDGITEAQGDKFEGCEIVQESPQKACGLPKETGTCSNFTIKYFFDTSYGACARFWYGGCGGNGNRFESEGECKDTCQEYKGKDTCLLPKSSGPCPGFEKKWYFNSDRNRCEEFNYGGCYGTSNRFDSLKECQAECSVDESLPPCEQPADKGPCQGEFQRWFYDNKTDVCRAFTYGGCKGNKNNYATEHACNYHCKQPGVHKELCTLPKESGNCGGNHARWHFSENEQKCLPFYYTGCGGNKNNFQSMESCEEHCPKKIDKDVCEIPAEVGECQNYTPRWYWDTKDTRCRQFYYGGCGGNGNNFAEEEECLRRCEKRAEQTTTPRQVVQHTTPKIAERPPSASHEYIPPTDNVGEEERCFQPAIAGDCDGYIARWFYNADEGVCDQFIYRGCGGNGNNFNSEEECENSCFHVHSTCSLPPVYGRCNENETRWHYDEQSKRCFEFEFSGCRGNRNNFFTEQECMDYCRNTHPEEEAPHTEGYSHLGDDQCALPLETGDCKDNIFSWYYNKDAKQCEGFYYTGCRGNANRFESREQCERQCGQFKDADVCNDPMAVGSCRQWETRFYYDKNSQTCEPFTYGGCEGNGNRFADKAECQSVCIVGKEPTTNRAICLLPPNVGNCNKAIPSERRWYYDDDRGTCFPFIYSGCSGNQNNFRSPNSCINFCANQTNSERDTVPQPENQNEINRCQSSEEQCRMIQCPYGVKTESDEEGCRHCECLNPCENYNCPTGEKCVVDVSNNPTLEARFVPICRQVNKPGDCPQLSNTSSCHRECYDDADCRDDNKCCSEGCSFVCVRPYQRQIQTTTLSPPMPRTEIIYPGEVPAVLESKKPEEVAVTSSAGGVAVLRCFATGNPAPVVTWRRGEVLIDTNKGRYILTSSGDLTIVQVHQSDTGSYICVASNGLGAPVSREVNLHVSDTKPNIPAYIYGAKNVTQIVTIKQPAVLRCLAGGHPKPHVSWWRGKNRMALTTSRYDTKRDYSLEFRNIELSDLGPYECTAYTGSGKPASIIVVLKAVGPVHVTNQNDEPYLKYILNPASTPTTSVPTYPFHPSRPHVRPPPPNVVEVSNRFGGENDIVTSPPYRKSVRASAIIRRDSSNNYTLGSDVVLNCEVGGYPAPNVTWTKDSKPILPSSRIQITEYPFRLVVYGVTIEDSGYYGCTARNTFSFSTSEEKILIESGIYVRPDCTDNKYFANCALIVKGRYCSNEYYAKFCCRSCTLAGQLSSGHPNSLQ